MLHVDVDAILPSSRDLSRVLGTRKRSVALVAKVADTPDSSDGGGRDEMAGEVRRLEEAGVSAFGVHDVGVAMKAVSAETQTAPMLALGLVSDREGLRGARFCGADGVCIPGGADLDAWDELARVARTLRMLPLAVMTDVVDADWIERSGARAVLLSAERVDDMRALAAVLPRRLILVASMPRATADELRSLVGVVDAAVVPTAIHRARGFPEFVAMVDP